MHISDGVLPAQVWIPGAVAAGGIVAAALPRLDERSIPRVAVLTSAFFVGSSIHVPLGLTSVHLLLVGLLGIVLGPLSFIAVLVGLFFQASLLGHGGLTTLGVNTLTMGSGAAVAGLCFRAAHRHWPSRSAAPPAAFIASVAGVAAASAVYFGVMALGGSDLAKLAAVSLIPNLVLAVIEGFISASVVAFLLRVKPDMLGASAIAALVLLWSSPASAHALKLELVRQGGRVRVEAFFSDGTPARGASVGARDDRGAAVAEGTTDGEGIFAFDEPRGGARFVRVVVQDISGHRAEAELDLQSPPAEGAPEGPAREKGDPDMLRRLVLGVGGIAALFGLIWAARRIFPGRRAHDAP
jgi:cobalt/nickel transport system permease protein